MFEFRGLRALFARKSTVAYPLALLRELMKGSASKSGASVSLQNALAVTTVFACVRVISEGIAQVPLKIYRKSGRERAEASDHPLFDLLHTSPNEIQTSFEFRETLAMHAALLGDAITIVTRSTQGRILELLPVLPQSVTILPASAIGERPRYRIRFKERVLDFDASQIWHVRGPSWNAVSGIDILGVAREAIGLAMATEEHGARLFGNGGRPSGILTTEASLSPPQQEALRDAWATTYGGENAGKTAILSGGLKWQQTTMNSDDSQFLETRRFQIEEICRAFRVMPIMIGYSDKAATYASAEQMFLAHLVHTLAPWYQRLEQSIDKTLLQPAERRAGYYAKFVTQGLMRADSRAFAEYVSRLVLNGMMTRNEARELMEFNPLPGLDEPMTPVNTDVGANAIDRTTTGTTPTEPTP